MKEAEERWGITLSVNGEPVPVPGHDWEWQIEAQASGARLAPRRRRRGACDSAVPRLAGRVRDTLATN